MRIEELVLEGFKSYPVRTQITGWDASFNAITGLNGSGKSNILDAICFVLGLTNMTQMRAQNAQDLVYKRGNAGITKASVTIVFDNSDSAKSPVGWESYKQMTVTRQFILPNINKYLLNGHKSNQSAIQTLFQSVGLNINNPNFLIMQGRITKVLNMRPTEILGMVEEAAGTRMFEERKAKAKKTMANKDKRVAEIKSLLEEEIVPKLDKYRREKRVFLEYQKSRQELDRLEKVIAANDWMNAVRGAEGKKREAQVKAQEKTAIKQDIGELEEEIETKEAEKEGLEKKRKRELEKGGKLKKLEEDVASLGKESEKIRTKVDLQNTSIKEEQDHRTDLESQLQQLNQAFSAKSTDSETLEASYNTVKDAQASLEKAYHSASELLQSLLTGLTTTTKASTHGGGFLGQLAEAKQVIVQSAAEEKQAKVKLEMKQKELGDMQGRFRVVEREAGEGRRRLGAMEREVEGLVERLRGCGWDEERESALEEEKRGLRGQLQRLHERRDALGRSSGNLDFHFTSPSPSFDRSKVKGLVATLIELPDEHTNKTTALEISAGGRLYNVVVEDEKVGKELLDKGQLRKRVTLIPLNKIKAFRAAASKVAQANNINPGKTRLALDLIGYPQEVANAMAYVFGDIIVCDDPASAKAITFNKQFALKSVTLQGDVYDPSGTLSGGAPPQSSGVLVKAQEIRKVNEGVREVEGVLGGIERREREGGGEVRERWRVLRREVEVKEHEVGLVRQQVEGSNASRIAQEVDNAQKAIESLKEAIKSSREKQKAAEAECKKLEKDMEEFKHDKAGKTEELKASIAKQKAEINKQAVGVKTKQKEYQTAKLEKEQLETDISAMQTRISTSTTSIEKLKAVLTSLQKEHTKSQEILEKAEDKLRAEKATLSRYDDEINRIDDEIKTRKSEIVSSQAEITKKEHEIVNAEKEEKGFRNLAAKLEEQFTWIEEDKHLFGKKDTPYHFESMNMDKLHEDAERLTAKTKKVRVRETVIHTLEMMEKRETANTKNLTTVLEDRGKIVATVEELDRYKKEALEKTWEKVSADFGAIFAELLPGNFAKLEPPEGQDLMQGLEVKVQLGRVWKQSLTELSGGQRSLIALSLIMALLQFKPAPMYILDEIDAALDLQHTQNIGQLFRTRFKGSQFIVVSLKEGLFTNANVLFKARFRDGTSIVERTAQRSGSALYK